MYRRNPSSSRASSIALVWASWNGIHEGGRKLYGSIDHPHEYVISEVTTDDRIFQFFSLKATDE